MYCGEGEYFLKGPHILYILVLLSVLDQPGQVLSCLI